MFGAVLLKPVIQAALRYNGPLESEADEFHRAVDEYSRAIEVEMGGQWAFFFKGSANLMTGQKRRAKVNFIRARKLGKRIPQRTLDLCN